MDRPKNRHTPALFSPSLRKLPKALIKELPAAVGASVMDKSSPVHLTLNPLFGRTAALAATKQQALPRSPTMTRAAACTPERVECGNATDKENMRPNSMTLGSPGGSAKRVSSESKKRLFRTGDRPAAQSVAHRDPGVTFSPVPAKPIVPPLLSPAREQPYTFTATAGSAVTPLKSPASRSGSAIYRTSRPTLTPRRRGSKIVTTNPLPHLLESVNVPKPSSEDQTSMGIVSSPSLTLAGSRIHGPSSLASPGVKLTKKEARKHRKSLKMMRKELEHGVRNSAISQPYNFVHRLHVEEDLTWKDLSGNEALSNLQLVEKLGEGSYGEVYKARAVTGAILVVKAIKIGLDNEDSFRKEIEILRECRHTNIVPYYGTIYEEDSVWILMEYCALGSLRDMIDTCRPLTESEVAVVCFHTLKALIYLHSRNIIHRDVKAANILLNDQAQVKIADFGVSEQFTGHGAESRTSDKVLGTPLWMAPAGKYDLKADIWSLGITVIEMVQGSPPFADMNPMRAMKMVPIRPPPTLDEPERWSSELNDFIRQCLIKDPNERPRAVDLFLHPFIEQVYSANPEVVLGPLISEYREAKEALVKQGDGGNDDDEESASKNNTSSSTSSSLSISGGHKAMMTGEFPDLTSSDTIVVRDETNEAKETTNTSAEGGDGTEERAWGTVVINAEEEAHGEFKKVMHQRLEESAPPSTAAESNGSSDTKEPEQEIAKTTKKTKKQKSKKDKRKKRVAGKKRKSVEESKGDIAMEEEGEEEWEKNGDDTCAIIVDVFDEIVQADQPLLDVSKKIKRVKKTSKKSKKQKRHGSAQLEEEPGIARARRETEAEAERERQQAMVEESLALEKQLAQIDSILDSIRGPRDASTPTAHRSSSASTPRRKSKIEARMERMRDELIAQRSAVPVRVASIYGGLGSCASAFAAIPSRCSPESKIAASDRLAVSAPPRARRDRGQKRTAANDLSMLDSNDTALGQAEPAPTTRQRSKRQRLDDQQVITPSGPSSSST